MNYRIEKLANFVNHTIQNFQTLNKRNKNGFTNHYIVHSLYTFYGKHW